MLRILTLASGSFALLALLALSSPATPIEIVSRPYASIPHVFGDSSGILLSADGKWAIFDSNGSGLTTNSIDPRHLNVYLRDLGAGTTTMISRTPSGAPGDGDSLAAGISAEGRFIVFESDAADLVPGDDNDASDIFLFDRETGLTTLISKSADAVGDAGSGGVAITRNGRFILFESSASNLSTLDTNDSPDLFLFDRTTGDLQVVTLRRGNTSTASGPFVSPVVGTLNGVVSEDGRYVAFTSGATNLVSLSVPTSAGDQLFLRDMQTGTNLWISQTPAHFGGRSVSAAQLSTNGHILAFTAAGLGILPDTTRWLYFYSVLSNSLSAVPLPPGRTTTPFGIDEFSLSANGEILAYVLEGQVYRYEISSGNVPEIASASALPASSSNPVASDDGTIITFVSAATNLTPMASSGFSALYSYDARTRAVALLTPNASGTATANRDILFPSLSADGSKIGFFSFATDLVSGDDKNQNDVFVVATSGTEPVQWVSSPLPTAVSGTAGAPSDVKPRAISSDGQFVAFSSIASDIVPNDNNDNFDVFLRDRTTQKTRLVSVSADGVHPFPKASSFLAMSTNGQRIAFTTLNPPDTDLTQGIYVFDAGKGSNVLASVSPSGNALAAHEGNLSGDGRYLAFRSTSVGSTGLFVRDLETGETRFVIDVAVTTFLGISPGGKYLVFFGGGPSSLWLIDWKTGKSIQQRPTGNQSQSVPISADDSAFLAYIPEPIPATSLYWYSYTGLGSVARSIATNASFAAISGDGSTVAYLQRGGDNRFRFYTLDLSSAAPAEMLLPNVDPSFRLRSDPILSYDGRYVAFSSTSPLLGSGDTNGVTDVFLYDRLLTNLTLVSHSLTGGAGNLGSADPSISADGRTIVFQSNASDLVDNDRNFAADVFVAQIPVTDSDHDGLEDGWEFKYFGGLAATAQEDADGDGISNLDEFLQGTNPKGASSEFRIESIARNQNGGLTITFPAIQGKSYQLQLRPDLQRPGINWFSIGTPVSAPSNVLSIDTPLLKNGFQFYRVVLLP